jgi:AcrR family transcriptional regulator
MQRVAVPGGVYPCRTARFGIDDALMRNADGTGLGHREEVEATAKISVKRLLRPKKMKERPVERRRGKALEDAVLDAAWSELIAGGYASFTMEAVAARARTSRPVLYRRWPNRADLTIAAIRHMMRKHPVNVPDTGNVRGDLIGLLQQISKNSALFAAFSSLHMSGYFSETNTSIADLRKSVLQGSHNPFDTVLARGVDRGEIDRSKLTPRIASLLPDLLRHELLVTLRPVPDAVIAEFVDDIFLPLVRVKPAREKKK